MKVLIVIDMQNDFVYGDLGTTEAKEIIPNIKNKILEYKENNDLVVFTQDAHFKSSYYGSIEGQKVPIHCQYNTDGWNIISDLSEYNLKSNYK